jgi:hypothetical protein
MMQGTKPAPRTPSEPQKVGELPSASSQSRIEVWTRTTEDGSSLLELVEYSWGSGIGWYPQKRMSLGLEQAEALEQLLGRGKQPPETPRLRPAPPRVEREDNLIRLVFPG